MTKVRFTFVDVQGNPLPLMEFNLILRRASFNDEDVGVTLPKQLNVITDATGQVIVELWPLKAAYRIQVAEEYEEVCGKLNWSFYVPRTDEIVEAQNLFLVPAPSNVPWDEEAMGKITQAVIDTHDNAVAASASADRAEQMAQSIEGDAEDAREAAVASEQSRIGAVESAAAAAQSSLLAGQYKDASKESQDAAKLSETNAGNSANTASQGATTATDASNLAKRWASDPENTVVADGKESSYSYSRKANASATASASSANASGDYAVVSGQKADQAASSAVTAGQAASAAATSAGTAKTEADRATTQADTAKTEADKSATSATAAKASEDAAAAAVEGAAEAGGNAGTAAANAVVGNKQDKSENLTAFSGLVGASDRLPYFTGAGALSLATLTAKAREFLALTSESNMRTWLSLVPQVNATDATADRLLKVGAFGIGANNNATFIGAALNPDTYTTAGNFLGQFNVAGANRTGWLVVLAGYDASTCAQEFMTGDSSTMYARTKSGGIWGAWNIQYSAINAQLDPQTSNGLMSSTVVNGWIVDKFLNGTIVMSGNVNNNGATFPANAVTSFTFPVPTGILDNGTAQCLLSPAPYDSTDYYSPVSFLDTLTSALVYMRNGPVAQRFEFRVKIIGRFK